MLNLMLIICHSRSQFRIKDESCEGHLAIQKFAIYDHMDPSLESMFPSPFGYPVEEVEEVIEVCDIAAYRMRILCW